jgi:hypothetical protein
LCGRKHYSSGNRPIGRTKRSNMIRRQIDHDARRTPRVCRTMYVR